MSSWTSKPTARGQVFALSNKTSSRAGALYVDEAEGSTTSRPKSSKKVQSRADAFKAKATAALEAGASQKRAKGGPSRCTASLAAAGLDLMWPPARDQPGFDYRVVTLIKSDSTSTSFDLIGGLLASSKAGKGDKKKTSSRAASATSKAAKPAKSKEGGGMPVAEEETSSGPGPMPRTKERIMTFKPVSSEDMEEAGKRPTFPGDYVYSETEDEVEDYDEDLRQRMARGRRLHLKRQIFARIDASPGLPSLEDLEVEVDLMEIMYFIEDCDVIRTKAKREGKLFHEVLPNRSWVMDNFWKLEAMIDRHEGTPSEGFTDKFKAWLAANQARNILTEEIPAGLVSELTGGKYVAQETEEAAAGGGEGGHVGGKADAGGQGKGNSQKKGKQERKGTKHGKRK